MNITASIVPYLNPSILFEILENCYNEIYVIDKFGTVIYVNNPCIRNYGLKPEELIGKKHNNLTGDLWFPSIMPMIFEEKRRLCIEQVTYTGKKILSTAVPVLDENNEVEMVVCVTEEHFEHIDIKYNEDNNIVDYSLETSTNKIELESTSTIFNSDIMNHLFDTAKRSALKDLPILIQGESGTGKSMLAKYIHDCSDRCKKPFISINCAAIPPEMMEAEFFGYAPHAFTGASPKGKIGLIEAANHGTLFLDEIGELAIPLQSKLLDVLENKKFIPIGSNKVTHINVRFITATNRNLQEMIANNQFREDLFWRLNVVDLTMPPLRQRKDDVVSMAEFFLEKFNNKYNCNKIFSASAKEFLSSYHWPGNVRQLKNLIERCIVISSSEEILVSDFPSTMLEYKPLTSTNTPSNFSLNYDDYIEDISLQIVKSAYEETKSITQLAKRLNVSIPTASRLVKKYITSC